MLALSARSLALSARSLALFARLLALFARMELLLDSRLHCEGVISRMLLVVHLEC